MQEERVTIPKQELIGLSFTQEGKIGKAEVNRSLKSFEPKFVFAFHFSIMIECEHIDKDGLPIDNEMIVLSDFERFLSRMTVGVEPDKPNGLFLARIDWNGTRELIWRVYEADPVHKALQSIIGTEVPPRCFDYRIDQDQEWKLAEWHLQH